MPLYEVEILRPGRSSEVRLTDRPLTVGDEVELGGTRFLVEALAEVSDRAARARYRCRELREAAEAERAQAKEQRESAQALRAQAAQVSRPKSQLFRRCSWCGRFDLHGQWVDLGFRDDENLPLAVRRRTTHTICPACSDRVNSAAEHERQSRP